MGIINSIESAGDDEIQQAQLKLNTFTNLMHTAQDVNKPIVIIANKLIVHDEPESESIDIPNIGDSLHISVRYCVQRVELPELLNKLIEYPIYPQTKSIQEKYGSDSNNSFLVDVIIPGGKLIDIVSLAVSDDGFQFYSLEVAQEPNSIE